MGAQGELSFSSFLWEPIYHHGLLALLLRAIEGGHPVLVSCMKVRVGVDEQAGALESAIPRRPMKRGEAVSVHAL